MTQEEQRLLLVDLSARLPYGVKCKYQHIQHVENGKIIDVNMFGRVNIDGHIKDICDVKPYLFPLSSMTEEKLKELGIERDKDSLLLAQGLREIGKGSNTLKGKIITHYAVDWCNKNHFDYRGLIEKGMAIDCTNLNIY